MEVPIIAPTAHAPEVISYPDPGDMPPQGFQELSNVRVRNASLTVRGGVYRDTTVPDPIGLPQDAVFLGGEETEYGLFRAYGIPSQNHTRIYLGSEEVSASQGKWGVTRFPRADAPVSFSQVRHLDKTYIVITNGVDDARVYNGTDFGIHHSYITPEIQKTPSQVSGRAKVILTLDTAVKTNGTLTFSRSPTNGGVIAERSVPAQGAGFAYIRLRVLNTTATNDSATIDFSGQFGGTGINVNPAKQKQLIFIVNSFATVSPITFWDQVKVELVPSTGSPVVVYDPSNPAKGKVMYPANDLATYWILAFSLDDIPTDVYKGFKFTWVGATRSTGPEYHMGLLLMGFSGNEPGGSSYGITYASPEFRSESPGVLYPPPEGEDIDVIDGSVANGRTALRLPIYRGIFYRMRVVFANLPMSYVAEGVSRVYVYRRPPDGGHYTYIGDIIMASWDGTQWSYVTGSEGSYVTGELSPTSTEDPLLRIPDAFGLGIPKGRGLLASSSRFFVGLGSDLYVSEDNIPFRFRRALRFLDENDPDMVSPLKLSFAGEKVLAMLQLPSTEGQESYLVFTDKALYALGGSDSWSLGRPSIVENIGLGYRNAVARYRNIVIYHDTENQLRRVGADTPSRYRVDNLLSAPEAESSERIALITDERFYLTIPGMSLPGSERVLVYNFLRNIFESLDKWPVRPAKQISGKRFLGTDGKVYHFESGTRDLGTNLIPVRIRTRRLTRGYLNPVYVGAIKLLSEGPVSQGSVVYRGSPNGGQLTSTLPPKTSLTWSTNSIPNSLESPGLSDLAVEVDITGNYEPSALILGLSVTVETREVEASTA